MIQQPSRPDDGRARGVMVRNERPMPGRILIIDDEAQITRVLRTALSAQAYDVRIANDPEEALLFSRTGRQT